jgi:hypothetical protein
MRMLVGNCAEYQSILVLLLPARYEKVVFFRIGLSLRRHRRGEYIPASFKGSWKGASRRWFLIDMHVQPQWVNMHLLPPLIDDKRGEPKMTPHLASLVKRVVELCHSGLWARHCAGELTLRWIHPLGRREKLAYECSWLADPSREPSASRILNFAFDHCSYVSDLINSLSCTGLSQVEIDRFMGSLFDKDLPNARPASVPVPFSSENPPPSIRITVSFSLLRNCS